MDPVMLKLLTGPEFSVGSVGSIDSGAGQAATGAAGGSFGKALTGAIDNLSGSLNKAGEASQQLATGQSPDVSQVAMTVERSMLELQLATQVRNKAVEAYQDIYRMQI